MRFYYNPVDGQVHLAIRDIDVPIHVQDAERLKKELEESIYPKYPVASIGWYKKIVRNTGMAQECIVKVFGGKIDIFILSTEKDAVKIIEKEFEKDENRVGGFLVKVTKL